MLRERLFTVGGALLLSTGTLLFVGLLWAGAGPDFLYAYLGVAFAHVLGGFFFTVAREAIEDRRSLLELGERARGEPPPP